jgi:hypothetical protein
MRSLKVLTTAAAMVIVSAGAAFAQTAGDPLQSALSAYAGFQSDITELRSARIASSAELEAVLDRASRHNRDALTRGWIAYGAYTAMQSRAFSQGVEDAASRYGRDEVLRAIAYDPNYARTLRGNSDAVRLVLDAASADGARVIAVADRYQELAYRIQRQGWANSVAPGQAARVQRIRALGAPGSTGPAVPASWSPRLAVAPLSLSPTSDPTSFGGRRFWDAVSGGGDVVQAASATPVSYRLDAPRGEAVGRMLSIAALQSLGGTERNASAVSQLMSDPRSRDCLEMAQLQLYQCMSAARFRYENAFCLGQHGLRDVGLCIGAVARPDTTAMTPLPTAAPARR